MKILIFFFAKMLFLKLKNQLANATFYNSGPEELVG